jgi:alpha-glucosidase
VTFKLDFLTAGKKYKAEIYRDGEDANYRTEKRHSIVIESKTLTSGDSVTMRMAPGGGFAIRLVPGK